MTPRRVLIPRIVFIASVVALLLFGLVMVYSASSIVAIAEYGNNSYFFGKQLMFVALGLVIAGVLAVLPYRAWTPLSAWGFWLVVMGLLLLTLLLGFVGLGARRWLNVGFTFQPGELAKIAVMLVCVFLFLEFHARGFSKSWLIRFLVAVLGPVALIALQPDLGTIIFALAGTLVMIWLGGMPRRLFFIAVSVLVVIGLIGISLEGFRQNRIASLLDPWADPLGSGYQAINSFFAFGDGGLFGVGLGNSHQKYYYLPLVENDFIFAVIGEELGMIGALGVVALFATLVFSGFFIARNAADAKGRMIAGTSTMLIGIQAFYNMLCVLGWAPITGKTLPFISAGGTSMLTSMFLVGMILWVSLHASERDPYARRRDDLVIHEGGKSKTRGGGRPAPAHGRSAPAGARAGAAARAGAGAVARTATVGRPPAAGKSAPAHSHSAPAAARAAAAGKPAGARKPASARAAAKPAVARAGAAPAFARSSARPSLPRPRREAEILSLSALRHDRSGLFANRAAPVRLNSPAVNRAAAPAANDRRPGKDQRRRAQQ
ncbi:MAG: putative lipid II flippase FtsW [Coriobacteriales bacterium]|jgi:cell division protein FtsW|nr:putative lipid II flippase FtsW [Coriobacteriales bacterium]